MNSISLFIACLFLLFSFQVQAQKIEVSEVSGKMSTGINNAIKVFIPEVSASDVDKGWKNLIKNAGGKTSSSKGELSSKGVIMNDITVTPLDIYAQIEENKSRNGATIMVFVHMGDGEYLSSAMDKPYTVFKNKLYGFARELAVAELNSRLSTAQKDLDKAQKDKDKLVSETEKLKKSIDDHQKAIESDKASLEKTQKSLKDAEKNLSEKEDAVKTVTNQLTRLE